MERFWLDPGVFPPYGPNTPPASTPSVSIMATNLGLRRAYTVWATIYDPLIRFLRWSRRRSLALLDIQPGDRVLILGCGTGADFEFLPPQAEVAAVDLTPAMLRRAAAKIGDRRIRLEEMDVMDIRFPKDTFDLRLTNAILGGYVTAVNRNFDTILAHTSLEIVQKNVLAFGGLYYLYLLRKPTISNR